MLDEGDPDLMTHVLIKRRKLGQKHSRKGHVKMEVEIGVICLQTKESEGTSNNQKLIKRLRTNSHTETPEETNIVNTLIWNFWPPEKSMREYIPVV